MKKRRLCILCLPVLLWFIVTVMGNRWDSQEDPHPWQEGTRLEVTGTIDQIQTKEKNQTIIVKNISDINSNTIFTNDKFLNNDSNDTNDENYIEDVSGTASTDFTDGISKIKVQMQEPADLQIGNKVRISGLCQYFDGAWNEGEFDARQYYAMQNIQLLLKKGVILDSDGTVDLLRESCRIVKEKGKMILESLMDAEEAGVMEALLLGEKDNLDPEIRSLYQKNGIVHVLAISGVKTLKLDIPLVPETRINWAFVPLHIAIIYILKLCLDVEIIPRCRFPCSRGYFTKCINWQKKQ